MDDTNLEDREETKKPDFIPEKYAKRGCRECGGGGTIRTHAKNPATGRVVPKDNNLIMSACGCAIKRYTKMCRKLGY